MERRRPRPALWLSFHFAAVLASMLTTWTRRLIGSAGLAASFSLVLP